MIRVAATDHPALEAGRTCYSAHTIRLREDVCQYLIQVLAAASLGGGTARSTRSAAVVVATAGLGLAALDLRSLAALGLAALGSLAALLLGALGGLAALGLAALLLRSLAALGLGGFAAAVVAAVVAAAVATSVAGSGSGTAGSSGRGGTAGSSGRSSTARRSGTAGSSVAALWCWCAARGLAAAPTEPEGVRVRTTSDADQRSGSQRHPFHVSVLLRQISLEAYRSNPIELLIGLAAWIA